MVGAGNDFLKINGNPVVQMGLKAGEKEFENLLTLNCIKEDFEIAARTICRAIVTIYQTYHQSAKVLTMLVLSHGVKMTGKARKNMLFIALGVLAMRKARLLTLSGVEALPPFLEAS